MPKKTTTKKTAKKTTTKKVVKKVAKKTIPKKSPSKKVAKKASKKVADFAKVNGKATKSADSRRAVSIEARQNKKVVAKKTTVKKKIRLLINVYSVKLLQIMMMKIISF